MSNKIPFPFLALDLNGNYPALDFAFPCGSAGQEFTCNVEDLVRSGLEDPVEKGKATHSSILA